MKTVAIYARVSTHQQEKQGTIESQLAAVVSYAHDQGLVLSPEHTYVDNGYSGARLDRPGLERLRDAAWRGEIDLVLLLLSRPLSAPLCLPICGGGGTGASRMCRPLCQWVTWRFPRGPAGTRGPGTLRRVRAAAFQERSRRGKLHQVHTGRFFAPEGPYG